MLKMEIKTGNELTKKELNLINDWRKKEFNSGTEWNEKNRKTFYDDIVFLIKNNSDILAFGRLRPIKLYRAEMKYDIWGIATIVSIERGKGYGKKLMQEIKKYIKNHKKTSIGFCDKKNTAFYKKCGLKIINGAQRNFVYIDENNNKKSGIDDDVIYLSGNDDLIEILLKDKDAKFYHYIPHW